MHCSDFKVIASLVMLVSARPQTQYSNGQFQEQQSNSEQTFVANQILQAIQNGGLDAGIQAVNQLFASGYPVSGATRRK